MSKEELHIEQDEQNGKGEFFINYKGEKAGVLNYSLSGSDRLVIHHTEVDQSLRGQGAGKKLLNAAVDFARRKSLKVVPICQYAQSVMEKYPETYADVKA